MANHAEVRCKVQPTKEKVKEILDELNRTKFKDIFTIEELEEDDTEFTFLLQVKKEFIDHNGYMGQLLWVNKNKPKVIEFRHGHQEDFMWWVDLSIENELGAEFNANIYDDGVGNCGKFGSL